MSTEIITAQPPQLTLGELKAAGFMKIKAVFTNTKDAIDIVNYFDFLANMNAANVDDMPLPYREEAGQEWKLTRQEATQLFFGHLEAKKEAIAANVKLPDNVTILHLERLVINRKSGYLSSLEDDLMSKKADASSTFRSAYEYLGQAKEIQDKIEIIRGGNPLVLVKQLKDGLPSTNWNFYNYVDSNQIISFVSRTDVILRHIDARSGMHYELNCGKFRLDVRLSDMRLWLKPHEHAVERQDGHHVHPHVDSGGTICFGNGQDAANTAIMGGDVLTILKLLDAMLPNYGGNPYQALPDFKKSIEKRDARERIMHEQKAKGPQEVLEDEEAAIDDEPDFLEEFEFDENEEDGGNDE